MITLALLAASAAVVESLVPMEMITVTPGAALEAPADSFTSNAQRIGPEILRDRPGDSIADVIASRVANATVSSPLGNPWQPQFAFRGYTASSLLGVPQGLSVYLDGVRVNSPFGDVVDWSLLPQLAVADVAVIPGATPVFGANTLGGALVLRTKSGDTDAGTRLEALGGSFGRRGVQAELGRAFDGGFHGYLAGSLLRDDGWRDHSSTDLKQLFAKGGYRGETADIELSIASLRGDLDGNGLVPSGLLEAGRASVYTWPDTTHDRLDGVTLRGGLSSGDSRWTATLHARRVRQSSSNGDLDTDDVTAIVHRDSLEQRTRGASLEWGVTKPRLRWALGASYDHADVTFARAEAEGAWDDTRRIDATGDGSLAAALSSRTRQWGLFATLTASALEGLELTLSGRRDDTRITMRDTGPTAPDLDGMHDFAEFNPSLGFVYRATPGISFFGNVSRASRAPTAIELGCADPEKPCKMPNSLLSDPDLKAVIAKSWEIGARGRTESGIRWSTALFGSTNDDDILFVGANATSGYFTNFGKTRRRGFEAAASRDRGRWRWSAAYGFLHATYASSASLMSAGSLIGIHPGDRMTELPRHNLKGSATFDATRALRLGLDVVAASNRLARGNEDHQASRGTVAGYAVVDLRVNYRIAPRWSAYATVANLFDARYATTGALAPNLLDAAGRIQPGASRATGDTFYAPGAPRGILLGVRYEIASGG